MMLKDKVAVVTGAGGGIGNPMILRVAGFGEHRENRRRGLRRTGHFGNGQERCQANLRVRVLEKLLREERGERVIAARQDHRGGAANSG